MKYNSIAIGVFRVRKSWATLASERTTAPATDRRGRALRAGRCRIPCWMASAALSRWHRRPYPEDEMIDHPPAQLNLRGVALFLDFDGTLVRFDRPDHSLPVVDAGLRSLVAELLGAVDGALAVISGRALDTLDDLFAPM